MTDTETLVFGRHDSGYADSLGGRFVVVRDDGVSPQHMRADHTSGTAIVVTDLGSSGGTWIRRRGASLWQRIHGARILESGDDIRIGSTIIPHTRNPFA